MKFFYPIQVIDLTAHVVYVSTQKLPLFEGHRGNLDNAHIDARLFTIVTDVENYR